MFANTLTKTQPTTNPLNPSEQTPLEFHGPAFSIQFVPHTHTIVFKGELKLYTVSAYEPMRELLEAAASQSSAKLCLDFQELKFLNSSGICTLLRFVLKVQNLERMQLVIKGSSAVSWHRQSLKLFKRVMPTLDLQLIAA